MDIQQYMQEVGRRARAASRLMAAASTEAKNTALCAIAAKIRARSAELLAANARDLAQARADGLEPAMIDRLTLTAKGIESMATGLEQIASLPDPPRRAAGRTAVARIAAARIHASTSWKATSTTSCLPWAKSMATAAT